MPHLHGYLHEVTIPLEFPNITLGTRKCDNAIIVTQSSSDDILVNDVILSLNGNLFTEDVGLDGAKQLFQQYKNGQMKIELLRVDEIGCATCCHIDPITQKRCQEFKSNVGSKTFGFCIPHKYGPCTATEDDGEPCTKHAVVAAGLCQRHRYGPCTATEDNGEPCTSIAVVAAGLCRRHRYGPCTATEDDGEGCTNYAVGSDGLCKKHKYGPCTATEDDGEPCTSIAVGTDGLCNRHKWGPCKHIIFGNVTCMNAALGTDDGLCETHRVTRCKRMCGGNRCIHDAIRGNNGYCIRCSTAGETFREKGCESLSVTGGRSETHHKEHPLTMILEETKKAIEDLKASMTSEQYYTAVTLQNMREMMVNSQFQPETTLSVKQQVLALVSELMQPYFAEKRNQGQLLTRSDRKTWVPLEVYVHKRLFDSIYASLKAFGEDSINYGENLTPELMKCIMSKIVDTIKEEGCSSEGMGLKISKIGTGGVKGAKGTAANRANCNTCYTDEVYNRNSWTGFELELSSSLRPVVENFGITVLCGLAIGGNMNQPKNEIPHTQTTGTANLYMMRSDLTSLVEHFVALGKHLYGEKIAPVPASQPSHPAPEQAAAETSSEDAMATESPQSLRPASGRAATATVNPPAEDATATESPQSPRPAPRQAASVDASFDDVTTDYDAEIEEVNSLGTAKGFVSIADATAETSYRKSPDTVDAFPHTSESDAGSADATCQTDNHHRDEIALAMVRARTDLVRAQTDLSRTELERERNQLQLELVRERKAAGLVQPVDSNEKAKLETRLLLQDQWRQSDDRKRKLKKELEDNVGDKGQAKIRLKAFEERKKQREKNRAASNDDSDSDSDSDSSVDPDSQQSIFESIWKEKQMMKQTEQELKDIRGNTSKRARK